MKSSTGLLYKFFFLFLFTVFFGVSCDKEKNRIIPYVPVSFEVNLNVVNELTVPGNSVYFSGPGYAGVIVYCELQGSYYAYDAACTNEISTGCIIKNEGVLGTCPCCKSQFVLMGGAYPAKGPASFPLQQYHVSVMNNILRVYN
jgi:Rieske Fe-S protein